jgi:hypothetical protein
VLFHATLDGDPIDGTVEFANAGRGPSYAARDDGAAPKEADGEDRELFLREAIVT